MDWPNERYVRVYTRDTLTWKLLAWQARTVFLHLLRKVDRSGVLELDDGGLQALAIVLDLPLEIVEPGVVQLLDKRSIVRNGTTLIVPKFIEAQETPSSGALRTREWRERNRKNALNRRDVSSPNVTPGDDERRDVTPRDSYPIRSSRADPPGVTKRDETSPIQDLGTRNPRLRYERSSLDSKQFEVFEGETFLGVVQELADGSFVEVGAIGKAAP